MNEHISTAVKVLFVCGSNSCRSQLAEGLLRARGGDRVEVYSAGTSAGGIHPLAARVMDEAGLDISSQHSKALQDLPAVGFDLVITLCDNARGACFAPNLLPAEAQQRLFGGVPIFLHWGIDDPAEARGDEEQLLAVFRAARDRIRDCVDDLLGLGYLEAFVRERHRLQRFADLLDDGVIIHDEFRHLFLANESFLRITGLSREDVVGRDCHSVFPAFGLCGSNCQFQDGT
ncbi:MAG: PAS domain-containing protein, partial [bacterium]